MLNDIQRLNVYKACLSVRATVKNLLAEYTYFYKTTGIFYATKENNVAQFKIKVEINDLLHCFKMFQ